MSKYFTAWDDPDVDTIGTNVAGWTARGNVVDRKPLLAAVGVLPYKRRSLTINSTLGGFAGVSIDSVDADANRANINAVTCVPIDLGTTDNIYVVVNGQGAVTDGNYVQLVKSTNQLILAKRAASVSTNIGSTAFTFTAGKSYIVRIDKQGTTVRCKCWDAALGMAGEPTTWLLSGTTTVTAAGWAGVALFNLTATLETAGFNFFAVGTNGDSAVCPRTEAEFDAAADDPKQIFDVIGEFTAVGYNASGSPAYTKTVNAYVSHRGFTSEPQDDPPSTHYPAIMSRVPSISIEMPGAIGGEVRVNIGEMAIANPAEVRKGTPYLLLDGTSGCYASTPDAAANSITGDIDIRCQVAMDDWTPAAQTTFVSKMTSTGNQVSYVFGIAATGVLLIYTSPDGTNGAAVSSVSTVATGITDGAKKWVRATLDINDGGGNRVARFYISDDGLTWTQLGSTVTTAGATTIFDGTSVLSIGANELGTTQRVAGKVYAAKIYNGIAGTLAVDFRLDKVAKGATSVSTPTGEVWTINGTAKIRQHDDTTPGVRDDWLRMKFNKSMVRFWLGRKKWPKHDWRELLVGCIGQPTVSGDELIFKIADLSAVFQNDIQTNLFSSGDLSGERMPILFGQIGRDNAGSARIEPVLSDAANLIYTISDSAIGAWYNSVAFYMKVYDRGVELKTVPFKFTISGANIFNTDLAGVPTDHGMVPNYLVRTGSSGTYPPELAANTDYWAESCPTTKQLTLSATRGGAAIATITGGAYTGTITGFGYTVTETAPASIQLAAGDPAQMRITVAHILTAGDLYAGHIFQDIAARVGLSANHIDTSAYAGAIGSVGYWVGTAKRDAASVMQEIAKGSLCYVGFSADGYLYSGDYVMPDDSPNPVQSFGRHNIVDGSLRHVGNRKAVDFSEGSEVRHRPWFLTGSTYQSAEPASAIGYSLQSPVAYGTPVLNVDRYPNVAEADRTFSVTQYSTESVTNFQEFYLRPIDEWEFQTTLSAFRRRPGDQIRITWPRWGFKQWSATDPASPDNLDSLDGRAAIIDRITINALAAPPIAIQVFKPRIGYYPTGNLT